MALRSPLSVPACASSRERVVVPNPPAVEFSASVCPCPARMAQRPRYSPSHWLADGRTATRALGILLARDQMRASLSSKPTSTSTGRPGFSARAAMSLPHSTGPEPSPGNNCGSAHWLIRTAAPTAITAHRSIIRVSLLTMVQIGSSSAVRSPAAGALVPFCGNCSKSDSVITNRCAFFSGLADGDSDSHFMHRAWHPSIHLRAASQPAGDIVHWHGTIDP